MRDMGNCGTSIWRLPMLAALFLVAFAVAGAHEGEDHGEAAAAAPTPTAAGSLMSTFGSTEIFELMLKYPPPETGEDTRLRFFLADYATNRPIEGASMALAFKPDGVELLGAPKMVSPGVYDLVARFPADGLYSLVATVKAEGRTDFVEIRNIYAGAAAEKFLAEHGGDQAVAAAPIEESRPWWMIPLAALAAIGLALAIVLAVRKRSRRGTAAAVPERRADV